MRNYVSALDVQVVCGCIISTEKCVCVEYSRLGETNLAHFKRSVIYFNL